jgi:hypothetical protein
LTAILSESATASSLIAKRQSKKSFGARCQAPRIHNAGLVSARHYRGRRAVSVENDQLRVTVLVEGGHFAEVLDKTTGINPLWTPPWPSIEPSTFDPAEHTASYGAGSDGKLLAGIMGHNLCLDIFGGPSDDEAAAGWTAHGEGSIAPYEIAVSDRTLTLHASLPLAQAHVERRVELRTRAIRVDERVESRSAFDRPIGWTQHVTLGPPFLEKGRTQFRASATRSRAFEGTFGSADYLAPGACFEWPTAPRIGGGVADLRVFTSEPVSSAYTAHLMDGALDHAFFVAFSPAARLAFGYVWKPADFPWLGIWEENHSRAAAPWLGEALTRGMEFGVSPFPESRRAMVDRGRMFDTPTYRWLPANGALEATYWIVLQSADDIPDSLDWPDRGAEP